MALTDTTLRTAKPKSKQYKMYDADGLFILIMPNGGKWWRLKYRMDGKEKNISLGTYPEISLKNARAKRDEAKALVAQGIDPSIQRQAAKAATLAENVNAYEVVAREWFSQQATQWTEDYYQKKLALHEKSIFPFWGARPIAQITAPELLGVMRRIEARGAIETAHRALGDCGCIFRYAIATSRAERDTAEDLKGALRPFKNKPFASIKTPAQVGELLRAIDETHGNRVSIVVRAALLLMPLVFVRSRYCRQMIFIQRQIHLICTATKKELAFLA